MPLSVGDRLGHYEVLSPLGQGGMGEVYRAHDPRVGRDVAIKVSREQFSERFAREARAIAALNHPNICQLYDVGPNYLVMELVEGESPKGPVSLDEALRIARQIGDALSEAHEKGVVHRDLKPGNIKVKEDGTVKVLDFGLAKISPPEAGTTSEDSPTISMAATEAGVILGTAAYMSPEQARGKRVDKRADIWAFGVVLYEMLTGRRPFRGDDLTETLAAVVMKEPDLSLVPVETRRLLQSCLEKDPKYRLRDIADAWRLLDRPAEARSTLSRPKIGITVLAAVFGVALAIVSFLYFREKLPAAEPVRFDFAAPQDGEFTNFLAISPDGRKMAFTARGADGRVHIWVHKLDSAETRIEGDFTGSLAPHPFWSADSQFLAYQTDGKIRKVEASGGPMQTICDSPRGFLGGTWNADDVILFGSGEGIMRVPATGGDATPVTMLDASRQETTHMGPAFLPDGRHFLYLRQSKRDQSNGIYIGSLDEKPERQDTTRLLAANLPAYYSASRDSRGGFILFLRESALVAQRFDMERLVLQGESTIVAEPVGRAQLGFFSVSPGALIFRQGGSGYLRQLTWLDRQGKSLDKVGDPAVYSANASAIALSPDGLRAAVVRRDAGTNREGIWLMDLARGVATRFVSQAADDFSPAWSPDGSRIAYYSSRGGAAGIYQKSSSGAGEEEPLLKSEVPALPSSWSRDGRFLLYTSAVSPAEIWMLPTPVDKPGDQKPVKLLGRSFNAASGYFSPDMRWIGYVSNESGRLQIVVVPFTPPGSGSSVPSGIWQVSKDNGEWAKWRQDGRELIFKDGQEAVFAVEVGASPTFHASIPELLFRPPIQTVWDIAPDGKRFLAAMPVEQAGPPSPITVVLNWQQALKK
jgi:Tol biopolymer transport system component/predicted Ser/Thr protein kinase